MAQHKRFDCDIRYRAADSAPVTETTALVRTPGGQRFTFTRRKLPPEESQPGATHTYTCKSPVAHSCTDLDELLQAAGVPRRDKPLTSGGVAHARFDCYINYAQTATAGLVEGTIQTADGRTRRFCRRSGDPDTYECRWPVDFRGTNLDELLTVLEVPLRNDVPPLRRAVEDNHRDMLSAYGAIGRAIRDFDTAATDLRNVGLKLMADRISKASAELADTLENLEALYDELLELELAKAREAQAAIVESIANS